ncbi:FAD-dependent oxidoreductase [Candidatus Paracaedibacter symbiosus]|uniref:FAD-dependent oxidoreductase n=1 Tax=Candidatus Paracaedibacter symbiosus TaxID=244582 RepID=UPI000509994D|nr:FAD-dependent monooxygenase [Candidatus Paracaedibacter symbiosus]
MIKVAIIGSGIGGMASALWLSKKDYEITLFDKFNPLEFNTSTGLSFNYTINLRGKYSLKKLDLWEDVQHKSIRLAGRIIHSRSLDIYQKYGPSSRSSLYSIPRHKLIKIFFDKIITLSNINFKFNKEITNISYNNDSCYISYRDRISKIIHIQEFDFIIASDGVNSQVRSIFADRLQWSLEVFPWAYKEFKLNSNEVKKCKLSLSSLHIWSSKESLCVGIPNQDKSISLLYCASNNKNFSLKAKKCIKALFGEVKTLSNFDEKKGWENL